MRAYHYVGDAVGHTEPDDEGIVIGSTRFSGTVRTRLYGCGECGATVSQGRGQEQHDRWHSALTNTIGHVNVLQL